MRCPLLWNSCETVRLPVSDSRDAHLSSNIPAPDDGFPRPCPAVDMTVPFRLRSIICTVSPGFKFSGGFHKTFAREKRLSASVSLCPAYAAPEPGFCLFCRFSPLSFHPGVLWPASVPPGYPRLPSSHPAVSSWPLPALRVGTSPFAELSLCFCSSSSFLSCSISA